MRLNKVVTAIVGVVVLLALCAGVSFAVVTSTNNHNLAAQRAAATASHRRAIASASAAANAKAIAAANVKAARAEADAKAAKAAASRPTSVPVVAAPTQPPQPSANPEAVVDQFYQDITNGDYADAWALGGANLAGGADYNTWVAGYATTTSITLDTQSQWNATTVQADITAQQSDGGQTTYSGTYTVEDGVITSANITQTGAWGPR
jgi:membrane protein involved in colicin uptake